jgi:hypothetical protein
MQDINLDSYTSAGKELSYLDDLATLSPEDKARMLEVGVALDNENQRAGTFLQMDNTPVHTCATQKKLEVMTIRQGLERYTWLSDYLWQAVGKDSDKYTVHVEAKQGNGYFIRALPGVKIAYPVQACLYMTRGESVQDVHNIVIAEEGSELHIIAGCASSVGKERGAHLGVSEFYIKKGAKVTFTMIHRWDPGVVVRPRTGVIVEEEGLFLNNYVLLKPVRSLQMYPAAWCVGKNATARFNSILVAPPGSEMDVGSKVFLNAEGTRTEIISRAITTGGNITARGYIEGNAPEVKGHLECRGLILDGGGIIYAVPELRGAVAGIDLSHEAAVGKIAEEEVEYLMARGLSHAEATATIVRGFLRVDIEGLPPTLSAQIERVVQTSEQDVM